ncbi:hypothetical protein C8F04DRAFT_1134894 [Mycena alexandri]|uniref:DUF7223 domain-containing protein n=1 Tax=Mycena alexandri TaxID=1745969 RepID=A0AAD6S997_9AGAR|nr:hypothetical protein C8F04DRAFT_1134894 [Mycena alexandri]
MLGSVLIIVPFLAGIQAANDWNIPCVKGQCSYDLPQTTAAPASGTMKIWGSENAITDITPAAGWQILGCDPAALSQNVRLVCMDEDDPGSLCGHLYQTTGAVNKIVRLPGNCGASAFARVANAWTSEDQSIPATVKARLVRRTGTPTVNALAIDTNWDAADWSKTGMVNISINAANFPGAATSIQTPAAPRGGRRSFSSNDVVPRFSDSKTFDIKPVQFSKQKNLFNASLGCGPITGSVNVDVTANVNAQPSLTFTIEGSLFPPEFTTFSVVAAISGNAGGTVDLTADVTGQVDSGKITLFSSTIPGLGIPGIIEVGPIFEVDAQFVGELELEMDLTVGVNLQLNNAQLTFPPDDSASPDASAFSLGDTPLTLDASPSVQATGTLTAHLIPTLSLGVKALGGKGDATIFVALDTSAALVLSLDASAQVTQTIAGANSTATVAPSNDNSTNNTSIVNSTTTADASAPTAVDNSTSISIDNSTNNTSSNDAVPSANSTDVTLLERDTTTSFGGCVQVNGNIAVNAGATGKFFGLFDKTASVSLFTKNFQIFKKCFGDAATPTRRRMRRVAARNLQVRAFTCPVSGLSAPASVTSGTVSSSSISTA